MIYKKIIYVKYKKNNLKIYFPMKIFSSEVIRITVKHYEKY